MTSFKSEVSARSDDAALKYYTTTREKASSLSKSTFAVFAHRARAKNLQNQCRLQDSTSLSVSAGLVNNGGFSSRARIIFDLPGREAVAAVKKTHAWLDIL